MESHAQSIQRLDMNEESINNEITNLNVKVDALHDLIAKLVEVCEKLNKRLDQHNEAIRLTKDLIALTIK